MFWGPSLLVYALREPLASSVDVWAMTIGLPLVALLGFAVARRWRKGREFAMAWRMLLGVWALGPLFMMVGSSFAGGGFARPEGNPWRDLSVMMAVFPMVTFSMAGYYGALLGLVLVTLGLPVAQVLVVLGKATRAWRSRRSNG
jgi:hypothetical protein